MARHKGVSKARWLHSQKQLTELWQQESLLADERARTERIYLPLVTQYHPAIDKQTRILDLCCGPVCTAQFLKQGDKSYLDPMLDAYRRMCPGKLPRGHHMALAAEKIPETSHSFDIILCINGLDHVLNPELVLNEIARLLKPGGLLIVGVSVFPAFIARLRYYLEQYASPWRDDTHPYAYSLPAVTRSLARHFDIETSLEPDEGCLADTRAMASEHIFICRPKSPEPTAS